MTRLNRRQQKRLMERLRRSDMAMIVLCERPSQAANIELAVGAKYGPVRSAQGHLLRLESPEECNLAWAKWTNDILVPPSGHYGYRIDEGPGKVARLRAIGDLLSRATGVIIATDADRDMVRRLLKKFWRTGISGEALSA